MDYSKLPMHMQEAVKDYIEQGSPVGGFLQAVFSNDLVHSFAKADDINSQYMREYAQFLYQAPMACWGSEEAVADWQTLGGLKGL